MKILLLLLICTFSTQIYSKKSKWHKHYNLVLKDIKSVERIKNRELPLRVRLFELYGEKLQLLLQKENEYRIKFLNTGKGKALRVILKKQKATLKTLEDIAKRVESLTKDKKILAKINYYRSLNYMLVKKKDLFYKYIKIAESLNKNKELGYQINIRLADYYYNEKKFTHSTVYYKKILNTKKDQWATKFHYNLAWSHLKLEEFDKALVNIKKAFVYENKKGYFKIGDQLVDGILLFYAFSKKTMEGLNYLETKKIDSFDNLLKYLNYIFKSGEKKTMVLVINRLFSKKRNLENEYKLTSNLIEIYRNLKKYNTLQRYLSVFRKRVSKEKLSSKNELTTSLVSALKGYSGLLQKIVTNTDMLGGAKQKKYVKFIAMNFDLLRRIDSKNSLEYGFYKGETYFTVGNYKKATLTYISALKTHMKTKNKSKFVNKTFESLFKSIEKQRKVKGTILVASFTTYLHFYPNKYKADEIYRRLLTYYQSRGIQKQLFNTLKKFNKYYPKNVVEQRVFYDRLVDGFVLKKNLNAIVSLKKHIDKGFLGYTKAESLKLKKIISEIYFSKYEGLAKKGELSKAIAGFGLLFADEKSNYELRVDSLRKKMFYEHKSYEFEGLTSSLGTAGKFFKKKTKKKFNDELMFYLQSICVGYEESNCIKAYESFERNGVTAFPKELKNLYFKQVVAFKPGAKKVLTSNPELNNYLFKVLLVEDSKFNAPVFKEFFKDNTKKEIITSEIDKRVFQKFYSTLSLSKTETYIKSIKILEIKKKHLKLLQAVRKTLSTSKITLPENPKVTEMNEQTFGKLGNFVMQSAQNNTTFIKMAIQKTDPNYLPFVLSNLISKLEKVTEEFKKFIPISKNSELEKAMNEEISNIHKHFDNQIVEYRNLYYRALSATMVGSGARLYNSDIIEDRKRSSLREIRLWSNY